MKPNRWIRLRAAAILAVFALCTFAGGGGGGTGGSGGSGIVIIKYTTPL